jgi:hypothetical protein
LKKFVKLANSDNRKKALYQDSNLHYFIVKKDGISQNVGLEIQARYERKRLQYAGRERG